MSVGSLLALQAAVSGGFYTTRWTSVRLYHIFLAMKFIKEKPNVCPLPATAVLVYQDEVLLPVIIAALQL